MTFVHTPANWLTLIRLICAPLIAVLALCDNKYAVLLFALAAIGDGLDGWVARTFACESQWGEMADPVADKVVSHTALGVVVIKTASISLMMVWLLLIGRDLWLTYERLGRQVAHPVSQTAKIKSALLSIALFLLLSGNLFALNLVYQLGFMLILVSTYLSLISLRNYLR
jgi:CDP-diacylglycerol--glycerol-3-phosphate 3-phosphatidyltransferase